MVVINKTAPEEYLCCKGMGQEEWINPLGQTIRKLSVLYFALRSCFFFSFFLKGTHNGHYKSQK